MNTGIIIPSETYLFSPWEYNYYFTELLRGVIAAASLFESDITILQGRDYKEKGYTEIFERKELEGLIILAPILNKKTVSEIREADKPAILINSRHPDLNYVDVDNREGAARAVEYLIQMGHRNISFIGGKAGTESAKERFEGYKSVMSAKLEVNEKYIGSGDFSKDSGCNITRKFLELEKEEQPTAIFCANDLMALGAVKAVKEKNLFVPGDISVVGFDDLIISEYFTPPLTSVRQPLFHVGKEAFITLTGIVNGEKPQPQQAEIKTRLIKRGSVADIN